MKNFKWMLTAMTVMILAGEMPTLAKYERLENDCQKFTGNKTLCIEKARECQALPSDLDSHCLAWEMAFTATSDSTNAENCDGARKTINKGIEAIIVGDSPRAIEKFEQAVGKIATKKCVYLIDVGAAKKVFTGGKNEGVRGERVTEVGKEQPLRHGRVTEADKIKTNR